MNSVNFDPDKGDIIVAAGDLIDRGEQNIQVLNLLNEYWFHSVKGNHEEMMVTGLESGKDSYEYHFWIEKGGAWYLSTTQEEQLMIESVFNQIKELPVLLEVEKNGKRIGVAHAQILGLSWQNTVNKINENRVRNRSLWNREQANSALALKRGDYLSVDNSLTGRVKDIDAVIFGHTPMNDGPLMIGNMLWLDTGVIYGNELGFIEFEDIIKYSLLS